MEKELEGNRQEMQQNREQMQYFRDKDMEFEKLLEYWNELHRVNFKYVPVKDDHVDKKLSEFINKSMHAKRMKCLFVRESEGAYSFFKKQVIMKCVEDNLIIRVGGGFMSIDQFIDQYNPLEQLMRRESTKSQMRNAIQQILPTSAS